MKTGIGGDNARGWVNQINSVPAGVTRGNQAVVLDDDALQRGSGIGDGGDGGPVRDQGDRQGN